MKNNIYITILFFTFSTGMASCKKYLDAKSVKTVSTIEDLNDLQLILDNPVTNRSAKASNAGSDEFYLLYTHFITRQEVDQDAYVWKPVFNDIVDWEAKYISVMYSNTALDKLKRMDEGALTSKYNQVKGHALFVRAHEFYQLSQLFAPQFDSLKAATDYGIPLRLNSDLNEASTRASVKETFDRIIEDLTQATSLLPTFPEVKTRPSKLACYGLLARIYLQTGNYVKAKENADLYLSLNNSLLDFNSSADLSVAAASPIPLFNKEVIYYYGNDGTLTSYSQARVDSNLYALFHTDDLRRAAYFLDNTDGTKRFKGSYNGGSVNLFQGLATDEVLLIRSECFARMNNISSAMTDLNALLIKRWKTASFVPFTASTIQGALDLILKERRKELIYRGLRWSDLRRLNRDVNFAKSLRRTLNGQNYDLAVNDLRYVLLIPREALSQVSLPQNPR